MGKLTESQKARMRELYKTYELSPDDVYEHQHYKIITRQGIDKIQARSGVKIRYNVVPELTKLAQNKDGSIDTYMVVKAYAWVGDESNPLEWIETFGESSPGNNRNQYPVAMAEKRAMSRAVLKLTGFYEMGHFSQDEADEFNDVVKKGRASKAGAIDKRG